MKEVYILFAQPTQPSCNSLNAFYALYRFGPLVCHWTLRFEAYFNFVNITYSLAIRHQYQCYQNMNSEELPGWEYNVEAGPGKEVFTKFVYGYRCILTY